MGSTENTMSRLCFIWRDGAQRTSNSSITTESELIEPIHLGEILMVDFFEGFGITQNKLAVSIGAPPRRINEFVHGKRGSPLIPRSVWRGASGRPRRSG